MAALTQSERDARTAAKRAANAETELRHRVRPGIKAMLAELMQWHGVEEQSEAIQLLIMNTHALGSTDSAPALQLPRHKITISENVAREFERKSLAILSREED